MFLNRISTRASPVDGGIGTGSVGGSLQNIKTALPSIDGNDIRKGLAARAAHPVAIQTANGELAFSSYMAMRQRWQTMTKNFLIASSIAGFGGFVYFYSKWAVEQDDLNDDFLEQVTKDNNEYLHNIQRQQQQQQK